MVVIGSVVTVVVTVSGLKDRESIGKGDTGSSRGGTGRSRRGCSSSSRRFRLPGGG